MTDSSRGGCLGRELFWDLHSCCLVTFFLVLPGAGLRGGWDAPRSHGSHGKMHTLDFMNCCIHGDGDTGNLLWSTSA